MWNKVTTAVTLTNMCVYVCYFYLNNNSIYNDVPLFYRTITNPPKAGFVICHK